MPNYLTLAQLAAQLQITHRTARNWCAKGMVPGARRMSGRTWRINVAELQAGFAGAVDIRKPRKVARDIEPVINFGAIKARRKA